MSTALLERSSVQQETEEQEIIPEELREELGLDEDLDQAALETAQAEEEPRQTETLGKADQPRWQASSRQHIEQPDPLLANTPESVQHELAENGLIEHEEIDPAYAAAAENYLAETDKLNSLKKDAAELEQLSEKLGTTSKESQMLADEIETLDEMSRDTQEEMLNLPKEREFTFQRMLIVDRMVEGIEAHAILLAKQREAVVLQYARATLKELLGDNLCDLNELANAKEAKQLMAFTVVHAILRKAGRYIKEGGEPDFDIEVQVKLVNTEGEEANRADRKGNWYATEIQIKYQDNEKYSSTEALEDAKRGKNEEYDMSLERNQREVRQDAAQKFQAGLEAMTAY
jgi:hypothetical protein